MVVKSILKPDNAAAKQEADREIAHFYETYRDIWNRSFQQLEGGIESGTKTPAVIAPKVSTSKQSKEAEPAETTEEPTRP